MKYVLGFLLLTLLTSCATVRVREQGETLVKAKQPKPVYPQKTDKRFISGKFVNPEVWVNKRGRYFYYTENYGIFKRKKIKLKVIK